MYSWENFLFGRSVLLTHTRYPQTGGRGVCYILHELTVIVQFLDSVQYSRGTIFVLDQCQALIENLRGAREVGIVIKATRLDDLTVVQTFLMGVI